jgi:hypothetical protein
VRTILLHPEIRDALRQLGQNAFDFDDSRQRLTADRSSIAAFTDLAGDDDQARYRVAAAYLTGWNTCGPLVNQLHALRVEHGVEERTIDYKSRRDRMTQPLLTAWMEAFRAHPGIVVVQAWDKRVLPGHRSEMTRLRSDAADLGMSASTGIRLAFSLSFLACVGHLITKTDRFIWLSDRDEIFRVRPEVLNSALQSVANATFRESPAHWGYAQWFADEIDDPAARPMVMGQRLMLSLPDLVAGVLARRLTVPFASAGVDVRSEDPGAAAILAGIARMMEPESPCKVLAIVWRTNAATNLMEPRLVHFSAQGSSTSPSA